MHPTRTPTSLDLGSLRGRVLISVEECGALLGRSRSATYGDAARGDIPTRKLGGRTVVPVAALLDWLGFPAATIGLVLHPSIGEAPASEDSEDAAVSNSFAEGGKGGAEQVQRDLHLIGNPM